MKFVYEPYRGTTKRKDNTPLAKFAGTDTPEAAKSAWEAAIDACLSTSYTVETAAPLQDMFETLLRAWERSKSETKVKLADAFIADRPVKAQRYKVAYLGGDEAVARVEAVIKHLATPALEAYQLREATRPSDEIVAAAGYDLWLFGADGDREFGENWFFNPEDQTLYGGYADGVYTDPICPKCGCSSAYWIERCGCTDPQCGCAED